MQTYSDLVELARKCAREARFTADREVARELWRTAIEYQYKAAALDNGKFPDVGLPTSIAKRKIVNSGAANEPSGTATSPVDKSQCRRALTLTFC